MNPGYTMGDFAEDLVTKRPNETPEKVEAAEQLGLTPLGGAAFALACMFLAPLDDVERGKVIHLLLVSQQRPDLRAAAFKRQRDGT